VRWTALSGVVPVTIEMGQQRTWDHIPQRNCTWEITIHNQAKFIYLTLWTRVTLAR